MRGICICSCVLLLSAGCSQPGRIVETHGQMQNQKRLDAFVERAAQKAKDSVMITTYGIEGQEVDIQLQTNAKGITAVWDFTKLQDAEAQQETLQCESISAKTGAHAGYEGEVTVYTLHGCAGADREVALAKKSL